MNTETLRAELQSLKSTGAWTAIAAHAGISYFTVQRLAKGDRRPNTETLERLTAAIQKYREMLAET